MKPSKDLSLEQDSQNDSSSDFLFIKSFSPESSIRSIQANSGVSLSHLMQSSLKYEGRNFRTMFSPNMASANLLHGIPSIPTRDRKYGYSQAKDGTLYLIVNRADLMKSEHVIFILLDT